MVAAIDNALAELPALLEALADPRDDITHVLMNSTEWDSPHPRRIDMSGRRVRLGWLTSQPAGQVTIMKDFGSERLDLLVVSPDASRAPADTALTTAADPADHRHTHELLTHIEHLN